MHAPCLDDAQLATLHALAEACDAVYGTRDHDIEFAFHSGAVFLLQRRPISRWLKGYFETRPERRRPPRTRKRPLHPAGDAGSGAALLASSLMPLNSTMIAVALPEIAREFGHPTGTVAQAVVASYLVAAIVLQSPGGKLGDRLGHGHMLALGQALVACGAVLGMIAGTLAVLAVARVTMAAGGARDRPGDGGAAAASSCRKSAAAGRSERSAL